MTGPHPRRIKGARWALGGVAFALIAVMLALLFAPRPVSVDAVVISRGPIAESVADQGYARVREAYIVSAPVSGRLERIEMHVGDPVAVGKTLVARIRPSSAEMLDPRAKAQAVMTIAAANAAVAAALARRDELAAEARKADKNLARTRTLSDQGYLSRQALDDADAHAKAAAAAVRAAQAEIAQRRSQLAAARAMLLGPEAAVAGVVSVTSPASGYVTRVLQESERNVQAGAPLVEVSDQTGLEAAIEFLSQDAVRVREGMAAEIFDWGGPAALPAVVRRVEPQAYTKVSALGVEEQRVLVLLQFNGSPSSLARLGPGYRLWGRVILRRAPRAIKAPLGALVRSDGGWAVYRIVEARARLTPVEVGALTDREAEILKGLEVGARVIVFPSDKISDGTKVRIR